MPDDYLDLLHIMVKEVKHNDIFFGDEPDECLKNFKSLFEMLLSEVNAELAIRKQDKFFRSDIRYSDETVKDDMWIIERSDDLDAVAACIRISNYMLKQAENMVRWLDKDD